MPVYANIRCVFVELDRPSTALEERPLEAEQIKQKTPVELMDSDWIAKIGCLAPFPRQKSCHNYPAHRKVILSKPRLLPQDLTFNAAARPGNLSQQWMTIWVE
ncbi:hypothetical protein H112_08740 [Trichophyton rubrum D6]|uniref:Uncharacterized protein n=3 Tax=Trichophyton TaxID=5550 RepID=A0A080WQT3_TRIRC|nr:uncharacterized protein TERG_11696 [Trichophyton rubrum CBS 118892]EZF09865.1 hypothetical protein H100_08762 [Trichophyton rubrum MR850]EZF36869.1 hypothetical protein H102_08721 [Trichophyton rubrum CBS 100081]EZF47465.1 hypothetical protein H103_08744 [Trichophyton rubrum CBS 288.86]EZF58122.1 hypothetical protein H104_08695 [Trichophyton rubrum CBS 289.86]EZF68728.1 hypothetical protein H105_08746 [Trichophyton soudanense CBS 452.61]EZF79423.1 hypothetical protein H110_08746 [Trichophy